MKWFSWKKKSAIWFLENNLEIQNQILFMDEDFAALEKSGMMCCMSFSYYKTDVVGRD